MAESPLKRQRLSSDVNESTDTNSGKTDNVPARPTTPRRRASYLSPTKASLARSHPDVLAKSPQRGSLTEPRGRLLRQELLGSRDSMNGSTPKPAHQSTQNTQIIQPVGLENNERTDKDGFAQAIAQSFRLTEPEQPVAEARNKSNMRSPLRARQAPSAVARRLSDTSKADVSTSHNIPVPKLVKRPSAPERQPSENRNEPTLPPTPVQLGIGLAPNRPRGLASSSSIGSKSGSGRHRRRVRERGGAAITSSPLKPKNRRPISPPDFSDIEEVERELAEEAPESDTEGVGAQEQNSKQKDAEHQDEDMLPAEFLEKQMELTKLRAELESLRGDLVVIESLADQLQRGTDLHIDDTTVALLSPESQIAVPSQQSPESHPSFLKTPSAYLNLLAPGSLQLRHETTTVQVQKQTKIVHKLMLEAPSPWPSDALHLSFNVQIDTEDSRIEQIAQARTGTFSEHHSLQQWIDKRLQSQLHSLDVGGVVWGVGQYFKACTERAEAFRAIDERYNGKVPNELLKRKGSVLRNKLVLTRYLHQTQIIVPQVEQYTEATGHSRQILLSYEINLTWTGDTSTDVDISLSGVNGKAQKGAKELFHKLVVAEGVVGALDAVYRLLGFSQNTQSNSATTKQQQQQQQKSHVQKAIGVH